MTFGLWRAKMLG